MEGVTPPLALQQTEAPLQEEVSLTHYNIHFNNAYADVNIQGILVSRLVLSHLFSLRKDPKKSGKYILDGTKNRKTKN